MFAGHRDAIARVLDAVLGSSVSVVLSAPAGAGKSVVLNVVADELAARSRRIICVTGSAATPTGLPEFTAQLAKASGANGPANDHVGQAFEALTTMDANHTRIVLLVDGAEALLSETLRFIQLACKIQSSLQVVFAGRPEFEDHLSDHEFAFLRSRLACTLSLSGMSDDEARAFIARRLRAAGLSSKTLFTDDTLNMLVSHGSGNPGRIGAVLDRALATRQRQVPGPPPVVPGGEQARAEPGATRAGFGQATQSQADEPAALVPDASRRPYRPAWALATMGLLGAIGLGATMFSNTVFRHHALLATQEEASAPSLSVPPPGAFQSLAAEPDQAAVPHAGTVSASDAGNPNAGDPAGVAQMPSAVSNLASVPDPEPVQLQEAPPAVPKPPASPNEAAPVQQEPRATVVVTAGSARPVSPTATKADDGRLAAAASKPVTPLAALGNGTRLASVARPLAEVVPHGLDPGRPGRLATTSAAAPDDRRCRDILLRMQLGEEPTDVERSFLRTGCRRDR